MSFDDSIFWPAFKAAGGMLSFATVKQRGGAVDVYVRFRRPGEIMQNMGVITNEYQIEYQTAECSRLAEADLVTIWTDTTKASGERFKVRATPLVQGDGFFSIATLTKL